MAECAVRGPGQPDRSCAPFPASPASPSSCSGKWWKEGEGCGHPVPAVRGYLGPRHPAATPTPHPSPGQGCWPAASSVQGDLPTAENDHCSKASPAPRLRSLSVLFD